MHPKALLDECTTLMEAVFRFDHPADAVVARYFREHKSFGPRERATLSDTVFAALRERLKFEWLARSGSGSKWRRLAILGFPGESRSEMLATADLFNRLGINGVKLHNLHVIKGTGLEKLYRAGAVPLFSRDEYVSLVVDFLERLDPSIVIHRLSGETYRAITVAPEWSIDKIGVHNAIAKLLESRDTWQGRLFLRSAPRQRQSFACAEGAPS